MGNGPNAGVRGREWFRRAYDSFRKAGASMSRADFADLVYRAPHLFDDALVKNAALWVAWNARPRHDRPEK